MTYLDGENWRDKRSATYIIAWKSLLSRWSRYRYLPESHGIAITWLHHCDSAVSICILISFRFSIAILSYLLRKVFASSFHVLYLVLGLWIPWSCSSANLSDPWVIFDTAFWLFISGPTSISPTLPLLLSKHDLSHISEKPCLYSNTLRYIPRFQLNNSRPYKQRLNLRYNSCLLPPACSNNLHRGWPGAGKHTAVKAPEKKLDEKALVVSSTIWPWRSIRPVLSG